MPLTVLTDGDVKTLLHSLGRQEISNLHQALADALHYYSTATEAESGCCAAYQPRRTQVKRKDGPTTLIMPASSNDGLGVKIMTLSEPSASPSSAAVSPARSSITLLDPHGFPRGMVNAEEMTAFRAALASTMLFKKRNNVHDLTVFGAGKQAYWHIRLALLLRPGEVHHLNIINRSYETAMGLMEQLFGAENNQEHCVERPEIKLITPHHTEYERLLKATVRSSAVIFMTTSSQEPLFPASYLTSKEGRKKGRYVAAIGSYKPHMIEIHPDVLRQAVAPQHGRHFHKHAKRGGAIIVDSIETCMREAGEIIQAGLQSDQVVELGELVMLKRDAEARRTATLASASNSNSTSSSTLADASDRSASIHIADDDQCPDRPGCGGLDDESDLGLKDWLARGSVIYKSVGHGLMDIVVGSRLVDMADARHLGVRIDDF